MTVEEFLDRIDEIMCGTSNAERAYLEELYNEVTKPHWISVKDRKPKLKYSDDTTKYSDTVIVTNGKYRTLLVGCITHWEVGMVGMMILTILSTFILLKVI